jgi:hypothetical protein
VETHAVGAFEKSVEEIDLPMEERELVLEAEAQAVHQQEVEDRHDFFPILGLVRRSFLGVPALELFCW